MKREETIRDIYKVAGLLEGFSCMQGQVMTEAVAFMLADCVDRLELIGAQMLTKDVNGDEGAEEPFGCAAP